MLNLASKILSPDHECVLDLGLHFVPTPSPSSYCDITKVELATVALSEDISEEEVAEVEDVCHKN